MRLVTFDIAKKLNEKGFDRYCFGMIVEHKETGEYFSAASISQVLEWLREKKIYVSVIIDDDSDTPVTYEIWKDTECVCSHQGEYFALEEWEECEMRAIEYALDNLI